MKSARRERLAPTQLHHPGDTTPAGHECLADLARGALCKILAAYEIKPHKVRYYLERRDSLFEPEIR
nr:Conserved hypothetical protein [Methylocystis sp. SC2]